MGLTDEERKAVVLLRLDNAKQTLEDVYYKLFSLRQKGDYDDWIVVNEFDIMPLLEPAEQFIKTIEKLINN